MVIRDHNRYARLNNAALLRYDDIGYASYTPYANNSICLNALRKSCLFTVLSRPPKKDGSLLSLVPIKVSFCIFGAVILATVSHSMLNITV